MWWRGSACQVGERRARGLRSRRWGFVLGQGWADGGCAAGARVPFQRVPRLGRGAAPRPDEWAGAAPGLLSRIKEGSEAKGRRCCCCCGGGQQRVSFGQPSAAQTSLPPPSGHVGEEAVWRSLLGLRPWAGCSPSSSAGQSSSVPRPGHFGSKVDRNGAWTR